MPDVFTKAKRSEVMSRIRGRGNKETELALAKLLRKGGITGWRRHALLKFKVQGSKFKVRDSKSKVQGSRFPPLRGFGAASKVHDSKFKVQGSKFKVPGSEIQVKGSKFKVHGSEIQVKGSKFNVQGSRFTVHGSKFKVRGGSKPARSTGRITPDFVFRKARLAVFVDGCFWHACPKHSSIPASHRAFWKRKLAGNRFRDRQVNRTLRRKGWRVVRIWEHDLAKRGEVCVRRIKSVF